MWGLHLSWRKRELEVAFAFIVPFEIEETSVWASKNELLMGCGGRRTLNPSLTAASVSHPGGRQNLFSFSKSPRSWLSYTMYKTFVPNLNI